MTILSWEIMDWWKDHDKSDNTLLYFFTIGANIVIQIHYILYDSLVIVAVLIIIGCKYWSQFLPIYISILSNNYRIVIYLKINNKQKQN